MNKNFRNTVARTALVLSTFAAAAVLAGCGSSTAATVATTPTPTTVVLVHGAWADGSSWAKVMPLLQQRGMKVVTVQLQRASLAGDAAIVRRAIDAQSGQVVLVGHSYGGAVITEAGTDSKVVTMVYVDAFAPGDNESVNDMISPYPAAPWQAGLIQDSAGYLTLSTDVYLHNFAADVPTADAAVMASSQGPVSAQALLYDKVSVAAWKTKPSYFVMGTSDQIIPLQFQQGEAARIKSQVTMIAGASHVSMVSHPTEVAGVIMTAVASVNGI
ncbi:alpha/beta hydrolase [Rugamonas sp.]|uniref:alpha/beta hydrolase n=1 Tax=Rugamonas sp. TaxID=1926287 RepID=UPI0025FF7ADD|nr:alpha/beta hydrolase [Rugamonas sp.]